MFISEHCVLLGHPRLDSTPAKACESHARLCEKWFSYILLQEKFILAPNFNLGRPKFDEKKFTKHPPPFLSPVAKFKPVVTELGGRPLFFIIIIILF